MKTFQHIGLFLIFVSLAACAVREIPPPTPTLPATLTLAASPTAAATETPVPPTPTPIASPSGTVTPTPVLVIERGELAPGFSLTVYAEVTQPTSLTFGPDGKLYVASAGDQRVYSFADRDGDHRATLSNTFASGLDTPLGLLWVGNTLYISYKANVVAMQDTNGDGVEDQFKIVVPNLPTGLHQNDGMVLGADGYIYMGLGSTCDVCIEDNRLSGSILRFKPDGSDLSVYASGFRNPYDVAFNASGDLFATDNGRDTLGNDIPLEELNFVRPGLNYGWPDCWDGDADPECIHQTLAAATFPAHSSVDGLTFYNGDNFPPEYRDNAFVAVLGSYERLSIERGVKRVLLHKGDAADRPYTGESEWFLKLDNQSRALDLTVGPDGGLYVADYAQGLIYRIVYGAP
jgi:putative membrane-bound dehydrogenase-like protein